MKYTVKTIRDTLTNKINVGAVTAAPDNTLPYKNKYGKYCVEALQVFESEDDAKKCYYYEKLVEANSQLTKIEKKKRFRELVNFLWGEKFSTLTISKIIQSHPESVKQYLHNKSVTPPVRLICKLIVFVQLYKNMVAELQSIYPDIYLTGYENKSRGGRPDLWKDAPQNIKKC